jgi:hypothetical protein
MLPFPKTILWFLVKDRRLAHAERANESRNPFVYEIGDRAMATQSKFRVLMPPKVKLPGSLTSAYALLKLSPILLAMVPTSSAPCPAQMLPQSSFIPAVLSPLFRLVSYRVTPSLDTSDLRYLNQDSTPSANPLHSLDIQLYNDVWFDDKPASHPAPLSLLASLHSIPPFASGPFLSITELNDQPTPTPTCLPPPAPPPIFIVSGAVNPDPFASSPTSIPPTSASHLYDSIVASTDHMFFISYCPEGTLHPRCYLVAVDLDSSLHNPTSANCRNSGTFHVDFYCRHPNNCSSSDACARWWRKWHWFFTDPADGTILFGDQVSSIRPMMKIFLGLILFPF